MKSIGIDIGTTTLSFTVTEGDTLAVIQNYTIANDSFIQTGNPWERIQDTDVILSRIHPVLNEILDTYSDISVIGITSQMHGIIYTDSDGHAVSPLYTWQDGRGALPEFGGRSICRILSEDIGAKAASGYGLVTHLYNVRKGLVPADASSICTIGDYLGMILTGRKTPLAHISQAAGMGMFDVEKLKFMCEKISDTGADPAFLPEVTKIFSVLGNYKGIPVSVSIGDNQASFLGSVTDGTDTVLVNAGTGSQVSVMSGQYIEIPEIETRPLTDSSYLLVGAAVCGGSAYASLEKFFREYAAAAGAPDIAQYDIMKKLLEMHAVKNDAWRVRTTFAGTRSNPEDTGSITGIRTGNFHPAAMIRGVLNGMAEELYELYRLIETGTGTPKTKLIASGNAVRKNPAFQKILEERFRMPLTLVQNEEEAAYGASLCALYSSGQLS